LSVGKLPRRLQPLLNGVVLLQLVQQCRGLDRIGCVEARGGPIVDGGEEALRLLPLATLGPEPGEVTGGAQLIQPRALRGCDVWTTNVRGRRRSPAVRVHRGRGQVDAVDELQTGTTGCAGS
jgi:hypothetical protein